MASYLVLYKMETTDRPTGWQIFGVLDDAGLARNVQQTLPRQDKVLDVRVFVVEEFEPPLAGQ